MASVYDFNQEELDARFAKSTRKKSAKRRPRLLFQAKNLLLALMLLLVAAFIIHSYMLVSELTSEVASKRSQLDELQAVNTALLTKQEYTLSSDAVAEYATEQLGMIRLDNSQIEYVEMSNPDKIEVSGGGSGLFGILAELWRSLRSLLSYLG